jgi:hypothetical protein
MPFWIPFAILGALGALFVVSKSAASSSSGSSAGGPQELSQADKVALLKTLPTRFVSTGQSSDVAETMLLKAPGASGDASALTTLYTLNMEGHAILVGKSPTTGETNVLVPFKAGAEAAYAASGSAWSIFLRPMEAASLAGAAGLSAPGVASATSPIVNPAKQLGSGAMNAIANAKMANPGLGQADLLGAAQQQLPIRLAPNLLSGPATVPAANLPDDPVALRLAREAYNNELNRQGSVSVPHLVDFANQVAALGYTLASQQLLTEARARGYQG